MLAIRLMILISFDVLNCLEVPPEPNSYQSQTNCILKSIERHLEGEHIFFVPSRDTNILKRLSADAKWSTAVRNLNERVAESSEHYSSEFGAYVIFFEHPDEVRVVFKELALSLSWNPRAKFLMVSHTFFKDNSETAKKIFGSLLKYNAINAVVMLADQESYQEFSFFTWNPFEGGNCGNVVKSIAPAGHCTQGHFETNTSWYTSEYYGRFKNCTVTTGVLNLGTYSFHMNHSTSSPQFRYLEMTIMDIVAKFSNISLRHTEFMVKFPGDVLENGTATEGFQYLRNTTIDILIGGYSPTSLRHIYFDSSNPYIHDTLNWCVPNYPIYTKFQEMFNIARPTAWILIFSVYFLVAIMIWWISSQNEKEDRSYRSIYNIFFYEFIIALAMPLNKVPRTFQVRYLVMVFVIFSFYIVVAYKTYLVSILADDSNVQKYKSQEDICKYNLKIYFPYNYMRYFSEDELIVDRHADYTYFEECMDRVALDRDSAICATRTRIDYFFNDYVSRTGGASIYCFKDIVVNFPLVFYMRKGSPLYARVNRGIAELSATGVLQRMVQNYMTSRKKRISDLEFAEGHTLKVENLEPVFVLWAVGNVVALCVFLLELAVPKLTARFLKT